MQVDYFPDLIGVTVIENNQYTAEFALAVAKYQASLDLPNGEYLEAEIKLAPDPIYPAEEILVFTRKNEQEQVLGIASVFRVCEQNGVYGLFPRYPLFVEGDDWLTATNINGLLKVAERYRHLIQAYYPDDPKLPSAPNTNYLGGLATEILQRMDFDGFLQERASEKLSKDSKALCTQLALMVHMLLKPYSASNIGADMALQAMFESQTDFVIRQLEEANGSPVIIYGPNEEIAITLRMLALAAQIIVYDAVSKDRPPAHASQAGLKTQIAEFTKELSLLSDFIMNQAQFDSQDRARRIPKLEDDEINDITQRLNEIHGEIGKIASTCYPRSKPMSAEQEQRVRRDASAFKDQGARVMKNERCRQNLLEAVVNAQRVLAANAITFEKKIVDFSAKARALLITSNEDSVNIRSATENYERAKTALYDSIENVKNPLRKIIARKVIECLIKGVETLVTTKRRSEIVPDRILKGFGQPKNMERC